MKIILSHPLGNANVRAAAKSLLEAEMLYTFETTIATFSGSLLDNIGAFSSFSEIRRRRHLIELKTFTNTWPWLEAGRLIASKAGLKSLTQHETGILSVDSVYKNLDHHIASKLKKMAQQGLKGIYAYDDGAAASFSKAKELGLQCFYDLPTGYWRAAQELLDTEPVRWPEWSATMLGICDSNAKLARKDDELRMADRIFVASQFTAKTLKKFPGQLAPIEVIPYGFPPVSSNRDYSQLSDKKLLRLLFVGTLSQQKGIADLFAAVELLDCKVSLTIIGRKVGGNCPTLDAALAKHHWIPSLPHDQVLEQMREHDVLVFPTLFDGFGLVITEAMSQGTPVITTERSAGPDLITNGLNGWLVNAGSVQSLKAAIENLVNDPEIIVKAGKEAMKTARARPWEKYGRDLYEAIQKHFNSAT
ncbi:glycosyltransferase family 4 protein [Rufibacter sp. XAAS-G3-1]|uniref:glycosyltransferase family 4 protein n=1 Tax=Rufibacter sp. XAAS-G3-1 TaxID=2729134 RepID=UPI0015E711E3|nr:glycosyltransferase family 4 protein [Rufibacter sp. XAAS-G3-1]